MLLVIDSNKYSFDYVKTLWLRRSGNSLAMAFTLLFGHGHDIIFINLIHYEGKPVFN